MLVVMAGLPASGKSTLARQLREPLAATLLDKDEVRQFLFREHTDYSREQDDVCVDIIYLTTLQLLAKKPQLNVILDGRSYSRRYQVDAVVAMAEKATTELKLIECRCSESSAKVRLETDTESHPARNRDFALYQHSRGNAEEIRHPKLLLDTDTQSLQSCVRQSLEYIQVNAGHRA